MRARRAGPLPRRTLQERPSTAVRALRMSAKELAVAVCGRFLDHKAEGDSSGWIWPGSTCRWTTHGPGTVPGQGREQEEALGVPDLEKSRAAEIFYEMW